MRIDVITSREDLQGLRENWEDLYRADPEAQYFLSWPFISSFFRKFEGEWFVLAARRGSANAPYVALMPFRLGTTMNSRTGLFYNEIHMGGAYVADYTGALCRREFAQAAMAAFAKHLRKMHWSKLHLSELRLSPARRRAFLDNLEDRRLAARVVSRVSKLDNIDNSRCPSVDLPETWDAYLAHKVSTNTRQKLKRLLRKVDASQEFRITVADSTTIERDIELLLAFWRAKWGPRKGNRLPGILKTNRYVLQNAFADGNLFFPVLWHGDTPLGALAIFVDPVKKTCFFYMAGRNEDVDILPSGTVLHAYSIRHAIAHGFRLYDFLRGNEPYKYSFGARETVLRNVSVRTRSGRNLNDRLDPRSLTTVFRRARKFHEACSVERAARLYRQVLETDPAHAPALYGLGQLQADMGHHQAAAGTFGRLTRVAPGLAKGWSRLGDALRAQRRHSQAAAAYREALRREGQFPAALYGLGVSLLKLGQAGPARAALEAVSRQSARDRQAVALRVKAARLIRVFEARARPSIPGFEPRQADAPPLAVAGVPYRRQADRLMASLAQSVAVIERPRPRAG